MIRSLNEDLYNKLRSGYAVFTYEDVRIRAENEHLLLEFRFNLDGKYQFAPKTVIYTGSLVKNLASKVEEIRPLIENIAFNIGMIELISYWKASCAPNVHIKPATLSGEQVAWWKKLYFNGLGEFFYLNSIHATRDDFMEITSENTKTFRTVSVEKNDKYLIPIGGGKDSAVTLELLNQSGFTFIPLIINPRGATIDTIHAAGLEMTNVLTLKRTIDPELLRMNESGFLNGHTPFSAMLAFYTLLASALTGYNNIVLSNESSANESTIPGTGINHQYSKSFEFEQDFREYYTTYISPDINYFSLLRPLSELQISRIFAGLTAYHEVFRSCNAGSKTDEWCGKCPKCLFTHLMLSAFLGIEDADRILGKEMLNDPGLLTVLNELTGYAPEKPFECVGTTTEVRQALWIAANSHAGSKHPFLLRKFIEQSHENTAKPDFLSLNPHHFVPEKLIGLLKEQLK